MIAITRPASITPSSMSLASSLASATEWIGTLRTSMALGMAFLSVRYDDGAGVRTGHRLDDRVQVGDDGPRAAVLDEAADGVHLGAHGAAGEVALRGQRPHLRDRDPADRRGLGGAVA